MSFIYDIITPDLNLDDLQKAFLDIPEDLHFSGTDRFRTQSRMKYSNGVIERIEAAPLFQSSEINKLENYGGVKRNYSELPEGIEKNAEFVKMVTAWAGGRFGDHFEFSVHQIRTVDGGDPVPEGRHRDGYEFVGVFVVNRWNLTENSAETTVWDIHTDEVLFGPKALAAGQMVIFDDRKVIHDAGPLTPLDENGAGRDVFILTYPDHKVVLDNGEVPAEGDR
ncbi:2OG-Fe dioxygenase family protein [Micrococcus luteus]|uniref:2OG-Fe dioxygenase family protein n=1 Tax=Micrococcus luteus TaxID=1270 RepID=UPI003879A9E9